MCLSIHVLVLDLITMVTEPLPCTLAQETFTPPGGMGVLQKDPSQDDHPRQGFPATAKRTGTEAILLPCHRILLRSPHHKTETLTLKAMSVLG